MTATIDAHARPPESMREKYKRYQKATAEAVLGQSDLIQIGQEADRCDAASHDVGVSADLSGAFARFLDRDPGPCTSADSACSGRAYEIPGVPGKTN